MNKKIDRRSPYVRTGITREEYLATIDRYLQEPTSIKQLIDQFKVDKSTIISYATELNKQHLVVRSEPTDFWRVKFNNEQQAIDYISH